MCAQFSSQDVRSDIAVQVHCALFSRRSVVTVDMRACSREAVWDAMARLRRALPPEVALRVVSRMDPRLPTPLTAHRLEGDLAAVEVGSPAAG